MASWHPDGGNQRDVLSPEAQGAPDGLRVPDSELWCRGAYDAEAEERRRANLSDEDRGEIMVAPG